ncbi:NEW3 domain-containing protein [Amycolatopsis vastitatis]|uniref:Alpha-galactosidase NEW3 domain-containing protein n=1 Tax=Amycolatopsis vastitatis TaxID=1905142 RepID=A0A229SMS0_9PSEU|nr:NEW3 domain-containing protein [Amycolatopsis vastitatis]OXM59979.1 hypothetical protein CF165_44570 [Amycolatopsis vastitatis]
MNPFDSSPGGTGRRRRGAAVVALAALVAGTGFAPSASAAAGSTLYVTPNAHGTACTRPAPCTVLAAQQKVREGAAGSDVTVLVGDGTYRLDAPLKFDDRDGGAARAVTWQAAPGARPVFTGAKKVSAWALSDAANNVYAAKVGTGFDSRQLYVDGVIAPRAQIVVPREKIAVTATGFTVKDAGLASTLQKVATPKRVELEAVLSFTDRFAPVESVSGTTVTMQQPAWNNNTYGYDTLQSPFGGPILTLQNAREFLSAERQWFLDTVAGVLYYKPAAGQSMAKADVELPRVESLVQVSGTLAKPVRNLNFTGLTFTGTSWLGPSRSTGFASQQTGGYLADVQPARPADAFTSCAVGCPGFEAGRPNWSMMPGAVQVSAATDVAFTGNTFTNLGSQALGIGNDANAHASGVGLAAQDIKVTGNTFAQNAAGGIVVGGIRKDAHHPADPAMTVKNITVTNNSVHDNGIVYRDMAGIFSTYVDGITIAHNEVFNMPYSGIAVGYGWGMWDQGGSPNYRARGTYDFGTPAYTTPTTARNARVEANYLHNVITELNDGACVYTLGSMPGSVLDGNFCRDSLAPKSSYSFGFYFDEGSRFWTATDNVFLRTRQALHANANAAAGYTTGDLAVDSTYASANVAFDDLNRAPGSRVTNTIAMGDEPPAAAAAIIYNAGIPRAQRSGADSFRPGLGVDVTPASTSAAAGAATTVKVALTNLDTIASLKSLQVTMSAPEGWTVTGPRKVPRSLEAGVSMTVPWTVTAPAKFSTLDPAKITVGISYVSQKQLFVTTRTVSIAPVSPVTTLSTFGGVPTRFAEAGGAYTITNASADMWGVGRSVDEYGAIYAPQSVASSAQVTARMVKYDVIDPYTKTGIMLRNDITAAGKGQGYAYLAVSQAYGVAWEWDTNGDGYPDRTQAAGPITAGPVYLKVVRSGSSVTGFWSADGAAWIQVGNPITLVGALPTMDAGMFWCSHNAAKAGTVTFDSFKITAV